MPTTLEELEAQKKLLLAPLLEWTPARRSFREEPAAWSATEVVCHLAKTEATALGTARQNIAHPHPVEKQDRVNVRFLHRLFSTDRRVKVPEIASHVLPESDPDWDQVLTEWQRTRKELETFLSTTPEGLQGGIFRHPSAGWMDLPSMLGFFAVHMQHHCFQLERIAAASSHIL